VRAMVQHGFGGPEVVRLRHVEDPKPGPKDVIVQVWACALNRLDVAQRRGPAVLPGFTLPHIAGLDISGCVAAVGADVTTISVGERVLIDPTIGCGACQDCRAGERGYCATLRVIGGNVPGGFAEYVAAPADLVHRVPDEVSLDEAAALPTAWSAAWHALHGVGQIRPRDCVVVQAATSSISIAAIQLAKRADARVVAVASSDEKLAVAGELGADLVLHYTDRVVEAVRGYTDGRGADLVLDHVGAATWRSSIAFLRNGGRLVMLGNTSGDEVSFSLANIFHRGLRLLGAGAYTADDFTAMIDAYWEGGLRIIQAAEYQLEDLHAAFDLQESRGTIGKVLVRP
jgi:NADPH:quinone reductase-like Zn-dependent oxidoreductase